MASELIFPAPRDKGSHRCGYNFDYFFLNHLREHLAREQLEMIVLSRGSSAGSLQNKAIVLSILTGKVNGLATRQSIKN